MAYSLKITPNKGLLYFKTSGFLVDNLQPVTSVTGLLTISGSFDFFLRPGRGFTVNGTGTHRIAFNNSNLSLVTSITFTTRSAVFFQFDDLQLFDVDDLRRQVTYKINSFSQNNSTGVTVANVSFVTGSASTPTFNTGDFVGYAQSFRIQGTPYSYYATASSPLIINGSKAAINSILQTPSLLTWYQLPDTYTSDSSSRSGVFLSDFRVSSLDTSNVVLTYQITKDNVLTQEYDVTLLYQTEAAIRNPSGLPS